MIGDRTLASLAPLTLLACGESPSSKPPSPPERTGRLLGPARGEGEVHIGCGDPQRRPPLPSFPRKRESRCFYLSRTGGPLRDEEEEAGSPLSRG